MDEENLPPVGWRESTRSGYWASTRDEASVLNRGFNNELEKNQRQW